MLEVPPVSTLPPDLLRSAPHQYTPIHEVDSVPALHGRRIATQNWLLSTSDKLKSNAKSHLGRKRDCRERSMCRGRREPILPLRLGAARVSASCRQNHRVRLERHCKLFRHRRQRQTQRRSRLVLRRSQTGRQRNQRPRRILEGRPRRITLQIVGGMPVARSLFIPNGVITVQLPNFERGAAHRATPFSYSN